MTAKKQSTPFAPASDEWLVRLKADGRSASTLDSYARDIRDVAFASGLSEAEQLSTLDQSAIDSVAATWRRAGVCEGTVVRRFSALRGFATYLVHEHGVDLSRLLSANFPTAPKGKRPAVTEPAIGLLLSEDLVGGWRDARDSAVFGIQSDAGLTPAETVKLDVGHVDLGSRLVRVVDTHLAPRIAGISDRSADLVTEYLRALPFPLAKTDPLFVTSKRKRLDVRSAQVSFRRRRMRLGVSPQATLMGLRHATAARLVSEGSKPDVVASVLGVLGATAVRYFDGEG
jgi:site-specific recombinase XerD